jgi:hypothetical protein
MPHHLGVFFRVICVGRGFDHTFFSFRANLGCLAALRASTFDLSMFFRSSVRPPLKPPVSRLMSDSKPLENRVEQAAVQLDAAFLAPLSER